MMMGIYCILGTLWYTFTKNYGRSPCYSWVNPQFRAIFNSFLFQFTRPGKHQFLGWTSSSLLWLTMMDRTLDWWVMNLHQPERGILSIPLMDHMLLPIVEDWWTIGSYYFLLAIRSSYDVRYDTLLFFLCKWYPGWWVWNIFYFP